MQPATYAANLIGSRDGEGDEGFLLGAAGAAAVFARHGPLAVFSGSPGCSVYPCPKSRWSRPAQLIQPPLF
jgi:hypothetical protein